MKDIQKGIFALIKSAIKSEPVTLPESFDWGEALAIAETHQIVPMLCYGVYKSGIELPEDYSKRIKRQTYSAAVTNECQQLELSGIFKKFSENNIDYMPLKGILLKQLYPNPEMRVMCDADILIRVEQYIKISAVMMRLGYSEELESDHELKWIKPPVMNIELHKRLIPSYNKDYYAYFGDGWQLARRCEYDNSRHEMSYEDQLIYLFTHFSKHFRNGGIGIRHLVDFWVFQNKHPELDTQYIQEELIKLRLSQFYQNIMNTINVCFNDAPSNCMSDIILERIFKSGSYGTPEKKMIASAVKVAKSSKSAGRARIKRAIDMVFLPYSSMCIKYPIQKKLPFLLPVLWVWRIVHVMILKPKNIKKRYADLNLMTAENINQYRDELNYVGLDFNVKE